MNVQKVMPTLFLNLSLHTTNTAKGDFLFFGGCAYIRYMQKGVRRKMKLNQKE